MKKAKKVLALLMAVMMIALTACGSDGGGSTTPPPADSGPADSGAEANVPDADEPAEEVAVAEFRDLGGIEIIVSDWWTDNDAVEQPPTNLREEEERDYRDMIFEGANFTLKRQSTAGWGEYVELFTTSVMAQDPAADIFIMSAGWAMQLQNQGLLYPLNTLDSIDVNDPKWNQMIKDIHTDGDGNVLAITNAQHVEPRDVLFFNKRLFEEAGIDPNEPYQLQANGQWTWDKFMEYCERLTRDIDGDGIPDVYGYVGFDPTTINGFVFSNYGEFIGRNADGTFYNAMGEPNFIEAVQFAKDINANGFWAPAPDGAEWDWFNTGFHDGHAAMIIEGTYRTGNWATMSDEYGVLLVPKGPRATNHRMSIEENVFVLPFNIDKQRAEDLMYAFNLYTEPLEYDLQYPDFWKDGAWGYQRFPDSESVDITISMLYEGLYTVNNRAFVPGIDWGPVFDWGAALGDETVNEKVESAKPVVDAAIEEVNRVIRGE